LWQFLIGNPPDYNDLSASNRVLGPVYYALFTIFVFFILVNMFVAIVSKSYDNVTDNLNKSNSKIKMADLKKPLKRFAKMAKAVAQRKPLYSETDLLRMMRNRNILEKSVLTTADLESELRAMGEDPLSLYIERLLAIHQKRKKFLAELIQEEKEKLAEEAEEERDRRLDQGIETSAIAIEMDTVSSTSTLTDNNNSPSNPSSKAKQAARLTTQLDEIELQLGEEGAAVSHIETRLDNLENKMDNMMQKLELMLLSLEKGKGKEEKDES